MEGVGLGAFEDRELGEVKGTGRVEKLQGVKQSSVQRWSRGEENPVCRLREFWQWVGETVKVNSLNGSLELLMAFSYQAKSPY